MSYFITAYLKLINLSTVTGGGVLLLLLQCNVSILKENLDKTNNCAFSNPAIQKKKIPWKHVKKVRHNVLCKRKGQCRRARPGSKSQRNIMCSCESMPVKMTFQQS